MTQQDTAPVPEKTQQVMVTMSITALGSEVDHSHSTPFS